MKYYGIGMVLLGLTITAVQADTWTVDDDGKADFNNLQAALDDVLVVDGDEILVMPGIYTSTATYEVVDMRNKAVWMHSSDGPEVTFIDGESLRRGIHVTGSVEGMVIEGFTIQNCYGHTSGGGMWLDNGAQPTLINCSFTDNIANENGGGMFNNSSSPTLDNCTFVNNSATIGDGGGMWNDINSSPTLNDCLFTNNTCGHNGGGMRNRNDSNPTLTDCTFIGNTAPGTNSNYGGGGAMHNTLCSPILTNCSFTKNSAINGGGMYNQDSSTTTLTNCTFTGNTASGNLETEGGGGMYNIDSNPTLTNCIFTNNTSGYGGGMKNQDSSPTVTDCTFENNTATVDGGGGMANWHNSSPAIENTTFTGNSGYNGGALRNDFCSPTLTNCLFTENTANGSGAGMWNHYSNATFINCIFENNTAAAKGGVMCSVASELTLTNCILRYNISSDGGGLRNIDESGITCTAALTGTTVCGNLPDQIVGTWIDNGGNSINEFCWLDCNNNGIDDLEDIANQTSFDCDQNGVPDECQPDCDGDGWIDACDNDTDIDGDGIPDNCEIDCNENSLPDDFEIAQGLAQDCNGNGIPDECDLVNSGQIPEGAVQWTIEEGGNGHWYVAVLIENELQWETANDLAINMGGHLATPSTNAENTWVKYTIANDPDLWRPDVNNCICRGPYLGGYKAENGVWTWVDGSVWSYTDRHPGLPGDGSEDSGMRLWDLHGNNNGYAWVTIGLPLGDQPSYSFIVEWDILPTLPDCNSNGVIDSCEMADNPSLDCNGNGTLDSCEDFDDCNYNEIPDSCDITDGTSNDVNMNGVPDECESDCNENGIPDDWEIKKGLVFDCNENMLPDECDIADGTSTDVNDNTIPDECEDDCNGNGIPDDWDIKTGAALDCNGNGIPDYCDVAAGCDTDCNLNGVPDSCDLASGTSEDINANNLPDECECIADITDDSTVDIHDILALIGYWESAGPLGDLNADGVVSIHDLLILVAGWGECMNVPCSPPMAGATQWPIDEGGNGHWYAFMPAYISWTDARIAAESLGGYLCCMETVEEWSWLHDELLEPNADVLFADGGWGVIIGGIQTDQSNEPYGGWEWITGTPFECNNDFNCNMENHWGIQHVMSLVRNAGMPIQFNDIDTVPDQPFYMIEFE